MSESSEVMSLSCQPGVSRTVLEDIEVSGVAGQTVSVKMVGCETEHKFHGNQTDAEMIRLCTPVKQVSFLSRFLNFFSFSYTYTKGQSLKELDLIGCTDMENSEDFTRIKTMTNADAVALFSLDGETRIKTFKKYIYYGKYSDVRKNINTTKQLKPEGLNIDLSGRSISKVNQDVFWTESYNHFEIEMLNLTSNMITDLPLGMFPNSTFGNTKYLDLSHNLIPELRSNIFENLTSVADLNLAGNRLKILSDGIFINNPLEVGNCHISFKTQGKFSHLLSLQRLDLSRNLLVLLEENILSKTLNLESLDLSNNELTSFSLKSDNNFRRLLTLNLAYNALITMDESLRTGYPTLRFLNISHNNIGPVVSGEDLQFDKSHYGMIADLSFNTIETLVIEDGTGKDYQVINLDLQGNPIKCDCSATDLKRAIDGKLSNNYFHLISDTLYCHSGNSLQKIDYSDLNCPLEEVFPDQQCQDFGCDCSLNAYYKEVTINCSASGLSEFPEAVIQLPNAEYLINLDLADNNIAELPKIVNFTNYDNIKLMNFSSNNLLIIDHELLPRDLQYLSLRDNNIHYLSGKTVDFLERQINKSKFHMQLGLNPFNCNCNAEHLHNFIDSHHGRYIRDRNDVFIECSGGRVPLATAQFEDFCTSIDKKLMPVIASVATLLALVGLFSALFAFNKQRILICLYSKSWSRRFFNEEYIDKDKNYDAFISYSHEDKEYVERKLLTGLEEATDSEFRYKVCVHS